MRPTSIVLAAALLAPVLALADDNYMPKFARAVGKAPTPASSAETPPASVVPDAPARILDRTSCPKPPWPPSSLRNEETGTTTLRLTIAATGEVMDVAIERSSGFADLDNATRSAMRHCLVKPAISGGVPVESTMPMQYVWTLI